MQNEVEELRARVAQLEKDLEAIQRISSERWIRIQELLVKTQPLLNRCSVCNLDMSKPLCYVCQNSKCPTGLTGPSC